MWTLAILFAALTLPKSHAPTSPQEITTPERAIGRMIDSGVFDGWDQKLIAGTGDAAAVVVTKIVRGRTLSPDQIERVLAVLNMAFAGVKPGPDAEPKTALFVL